MKDENLKMHYKLWWHILNVSFKQHKLFYRTRLKQYIYKKTPKRIIKWMIKDELNKWGDWENKSTLAKLYISDHPEFFSSGDDDLEPSFDYNIRIVSENKQARDNVQRKMAIRRGDITPYRDKPYRDKRAS